MAIIIEQHGVYVIHRNNTLTAYASFGHNLLHERDVTGFDDMTILEMSQYITEDYNQEPDDD